MSSEPPSDVPSPAELVAERGRALLEALAQRVPGSGEHAATTASWALAVAAELGLGSERCLAIRETARLHDIGKVYADAELIAVPERELSAENARRLDAHAAVGSRLAQGAGVPPEACGWLRFTRERYDGSGLPSGIFGGAIPLESRIIRTACAFDLSLGEAARSPEWRSAPSLLALTELRAAAGTELDRGAVEALVAVVERTTSPT